jgi:hypothetical protein
MDQARHVFERVLELRNDVGLLSEHYDCKPAHCSLSRERGAAGTVSA